MSQEIPERFQAELNGWREISRDDFFTTVGKTDVHPRPQITNPYPWMIHWETPARNVVGKSFQIEDGKKITECGEIFSRYFVRK